MKCLSLWEPWATAIAFDLKRIETRSWSTAYRGPVAIHAARTTLHAGVIHSPEVKAYFERVGITRVEQLSFGRIVAVARIKQVFRSEELAERIPCVVCGGVDQWATMGRPCEQCSGTGFAWKLKIPRQEFEFGNYEAGRFGWDLTDVHRLKEPIPLRGMQGLFHLPHGALDGAQFV